MEFIHDLFEYFSEQSVEYRIAFDAYVLLVVTVFPCFGLVLLCDISDFIKKIILKNKKNEGTMTNDS